MKIKLPRPVEWEGETYEDLDLDLDRLTGADALAVTRLLRQRHPREPVLQAETDDRYLVAMAARAARVPEALLEALPIQTFVRIRTEVQGFLLGAVSAETPAES